mgnify:CR=1 FL=1
MNIYLDESGSLSRNNGNYFIVGSYTIGDPQRIGNAFRKWQKRIFRDQRILKGIVVSEFNNRLKDRLLPGLPNKITIQIQAMDSTTNPQIQVADWVCGAIARYHEQKPRGEECFNILRNNIVKQKELFSDYWTKKWSGSANSGVPKLKTSVPLVRT